MQLILLKDEDLEDGDGDISYIRWKFIRVLSDLLSFYHFLIVIDCSCTLDAITH